MKGPTPASEPPASDLEVRLDSIAEAYLTRLKAGASPDRRAIVSAHPEIAKDLERHLVLVERLHSAKAPRTVEKGHLGPDDSGPEFDPASLVAGQAHSPPEKIGPYNILWDLGSGGMGEVYLAEQTSPVRRRVAIKLIKLGMDTREVVARFEIERQALALMNHPNIARVYEAGVGESGRPYFVMEYVPGEPITEFCDNRHLTTEERLKLFVQVCDAVQHAHYKGVIHRDLKPSNILVTVRDGNPVPKIIDFGVAKATDQRLTERTFSTEQGRMIGTPEYMSPEQAGAASPEADTRTDIYSLGVILYEIVVGALPFESEELRRLPYDEIRKKIREEDPPTPSRRLRTLPKAGRVAAHRRRKDPQSLVRILEGDLDWVVMKAMEKDPWRRYPTAAELSGDVERHLQHKPVLARPPSSSYQLKKFVRRHKTAVAGVLSVAVVLTAGLLVSTVLYVRAEAERDRAEKEAARAEAINQFLEGMLSTVESEFSSRDVDVAEVLAGAAKAIESPSGDHPETASSLRESMGRVYLGYGYPGKAQAQFQAALDIRRRLFGEEDPRTLRSINLLASALRSQGKYAEADEMLRPVLETCRRALGEDHPVTQEVMTTFAMVLGDRGELREADPILQQVLKVRRRLFGDEDPSTLTSMENLAALLQSQGRQAEAEPLLRQVLKGRQQVLGELHPRTMLAIHNFARSLSHQERFAEAEPLFRKALEYYEKILGEEHPSTLRAMSDLSVALVNQDRAEEAETLSRKALETGLRVLKGGDVRLAALRGALGRCLEDLGRYDEAETELIQSYRILSEVHGSDHHQAQVVVRQLINFYLAWDKLGKARLYSDLLAADRTGEGKE